MVKVSARNNELLNSTKAKTSPKIYALLMELVNEGREDLAEMVLKIDFLLDYVNTCLKQKDFDEGRETLENARKRINALRDEGVDTAVFDYLYEGFIKKMK